MGLINRIKKWLCKDELEAFNESSRRFVDAYKSMELKYKETEKKLDVVRDVFDHCPEDTSIIGIDKNRIGEEFLVVREISGSVDIYLYNLSSERNHSHIYAEYTVNENGEKGMHIIDCIALDENYGNGSLLLKWLKKQATLLDVKYITGALVPIDKNKFDKLEHFYEKNGFEVLFNDSHTEGRICINL